MHGSAHFINAVLFYVINNNAHVNCLFVRSSCACFICKYFSGPVKRRCALCAQKTKQQREEEENVELYHQQWRCISLFRSHSCPHIWQHFFPPTWKKQFKCINSAHLCCIIVHVFCWIIHSMDLMWVLRLFIFVYVPFLILNYITSCCWCYCYCCHCVCVCGKPKEVKDIVNILCIVLWMCSKRNSAFVFAILSRSLLLHLSMHFCVRSNFWIIQV